MTDEEYEAHRADVALRADIIEGVIRASIVNIDGDYDRLSSTKYTQYQVRAAIAMALTLYHDKDEALIKMLNQVTKRVDIGTLSV